MQHPHKDDDKKNQQNDRELRKTKKKLISEMYEKQGQRKKEN